MLWVGSSGVDGRILKEMVRVLNSITLTRTVPGSTSTSTPFTELKIWIESSCRSCSGHHPSGPCPIHWILACCSSIHSIVALHAPHVQNTTPHPQLVNYYIYHSIPISLASHPMHAIFSFSKPRIFFLKKKSFYFHH